MSKDTGGPAFPCLEATMTGIDSHGQERFDTEARGGMSLRDYFAAKAMIRLTGADPDGLHSADTLAALSYHLADAMIRARAA